MLVRKENKIIRNKSCMHRRFESSGDMIETLDDLQTYLRDLCQGCGFAGDIKSKEGVEGVCDPSEGYTDLDLRVSKLNPRPTIEVFSFDTDKINWNGFVKDVVGRLKRGSRGRKFDDDQIYNTIYESVVEFVLNGRGENDILVDRFTLPISKDDLQSKIRNCTNDVESEVEDYAVATFYDDIKDSL